ncbi:response regulator transcription factor [Patescibacteria group bacterium]|nr:response regulator transcription factor [Patescibacteria group bacterium]
MRILVVEDNDMICSTLARCLEDEFFVVDTAATGSQASLLARTNEYDAIILDYMLPDKDGSLVCQEIRASGNSVPILMLSAICNTHEKIKLLELGADDYMTKPFLLKEVYARLNALLRRPQKIVLDTCSIGEVTIDSVKHRVVVDNKEIYLTRKEFILLQYLVRNTETVVSRGMIMEHVWNTEADPFSNTIEAHIFNLRKKLGTAAKLVIHTIPGHGYRLTATTPTV